MDRLLRLVVALLVLIMGPVLGVVAYRIADSYERDRTQARFDEFFSGRASALERDLLWALEL